MDEVICVSSSITLLDGHSLILVKVGEGRLRESRGKGKKGERRVEDNKVEEDIDVNL